MSHESAVASEGSAVIVTNVGFETDAGSPFLENRDGSFPSATDAHAPIIAFVNFKSGGKKGQSLVRLLLAELGRECVFNLAAVNPLEVIDRHRNVAGLRIVACGGDGTVNWVLSSIANLKMDPQPCVGIIPLGTGNDTSRHFGWSHKLRDAQTVVTYLRRMRQMSCPTRPFDRWTLLLSFPLVNGRSPAAAEDATQATLHPFLRRMPRVSAAEYHSRLAAAGLTANSHLAAPADDASTAPGGVSSSDVAVSVEAASGAAAAPAPSAGAGAGDGELHLLWTFNNYFSFGIDAEIMDSFHRHRESSPGCYCCRCCNMVWVGLFSPINCCSCKSRPLDLAVDYMTSAATAGAGPAGRASGAGAGAPSAAAPEPVSWTHAPGVNPAAMKSLIFLNLPSYAGGRDIWDSNTPECKPSDAISEVVRPSSNDGIVEVLGFDGYNHMSATVMRVGPRATRLGQVPGARVGVRSQTFCQLDGEAWQMDHGRIELVRAPTVMMLVNEPSDKQAACCDC